MKKTMIKVSKNKMVWIRFLFMLPIWVMSFYSIQIAFIIFSGLVFLAVEAQVELNDLVVNKYRELRGWRVKDAGK